MAWFDSKTLYLSVSLFGLPILVLCMIMCLPLVLFSIVTLYLSAWAIYLWMAQTDTEFNLPYHPTRVLKINVAALQLIIGMLNDIPLVLAYLRWRYWELGNDGYHSIVSCNVRFTADCTLDVYHPTLPDGGTAPIIIFVYGGSWSSGSKAMYATLANTWRELGYVVLVPDYRKYPAVKVDSMYDDIRQAIQWAYRHASQFNGDVEMIYVMGHSAGAHLASQVVLSDMVDKTLFASQNAYIKTSEKTSDKHEPLLMGAQRLLETPQVEGLILTAGVYSIERHVEHERSRGVERISAMSRAMGGTLQGFHDNSPLELIKRHQALFGTSEDIVDFMPRILLIHGETDTTVPKEQSTDMYTVLGDVLPPERREEVDVRMRLYKRMNHAQCVTAQMPSVLGTTRLQRSLIREIQAFIDVPPAAGDE